MWRFNLLHLEDMKRAAVQLSLHGARNVVIKGGHLPGKVCADVLYDGKSFREFSVKRIQTKNTHGTGCTFASAIAAELARGKDVYEAVRIAKKYLTNALKSSRHFSLGKGHGPLNHIYGLIPRNQR